MFCGSTSGIFVIQIVFVLNLYVAIIVLFGCWMKVENNIFFEFQKEHSKPNFDVLQKVFDEEKVVFLTFFKHNL